MSETLQSANAGPRLDRLPVSPWHWWLSALITAGLFVDTFELYSGGSILAAMVHDGWSTPAVNATFLSVTFIGLVLGAWFAGILGDRFGRRFCYQTNLALFGLASIAGAFAPDMTTLIGLRFLMGLGLGAEVVVGYATLTEFLPKASRGQMMAAIVMVVNTSFFISLVVAYYVIPAFSWRAMFLIPGVSALGIWLARKSMPESPRWLESKGRRSEADAVLLRIEAKVSRGRALPAYVPAPPVRTEPVSARILFSSGVLRNTLVGITVNITVGFSLYGFLQWLPTVFVQQGLTLGSSLQIAMVLAVGKSAGALGCTFLTDRIGRKPCIVIFSALAAVIGAGLVFTTGLTFLIVAFLLAVSMGLANALAVTIYTPELFETRFRMRGTGMCNASGRLATAGLQYAVVWLLSWGGLAAITGALSGALLVQAAAVGFFGIETRKRPLDTADVSVREMGREMGRDDAVAPAIASP